MSTHRNIALASHTLKQVKQLPATKNGCKSQRSGTFGKRRDFVGPSPNEFGNNFSFVGSSKYWRGQFWINGWTCISLDDARVVFRWDRDFFFRRPSGPKLMDGKEPPKCRRFQRPASLCPASKAVIYARDPPAGPARYQATYFFSQLILTVPLSRLLLATRALLGDDRLVDGAELRQRLFFDR